MPSKYTSKKNKNENSPSPDTNGYHFESPVKVAAPDFADILFTIVQTGSDYD